MDETRQSQRYYEEPLTWQWWGVITVVSVVVFMWVLLAIELHYM